MATHNRCRGITRDAAQLPAKRNSMSASRFQSNNLLCKRFTRRSKGARRSPGVPLASTEFHSLFLRIDCVSRRITRYQAFHSIIPTFQSFARRLNGFSRVSLAVPGKNLPFKRFIRAFQRLTHSRGVSSACPSAKQYHKPSKTRDEPAASWGSLDRVYQVTCVEITEGATRDE